MLYVQRSTLKYMEITVQQLLVLGLNIILKFVFYFLLIISVIFVIKFYQIIIFLFVYSICNLNIPSKKYKIW